MQKCGSRLTFPKRDSNMSSWDLMRKTYLLENGNISSMRTFLTTATIIEIRAIPFLDAQLRRAKMRSGKRRSKKWQTLTMKMLEPRREFDQRIRLIKNNKIRMLIPGKRDQ